MGRLDSDGSVKLSEFEGLETLASVNRIIITACGTAAYAGEVAKYAIEKWAKLPTSVELAHELRYRDPVIDDKTLVIAISQSGETMDTLMAIRYVKERGAKVLSVCNTQGATLARESDATIYTHAGPEVAVASTKAFTAQITAGLLVALALASLRKSMPESELKALGQELLKLPRGVKSVLESVDRMRELGKQRSRCADAAQVNFDLHEDLGQLSAMHDITLYRIVQECMTNTVKHARCTRIDIRLDIDPGAGRVSLRVRDDGEPRPHATPDSGFGLVGMRERALALGGDCRAGPRPEGGWQVEAWLPLKTSLQEKT
jgi:D-arabinose 5-phosphate isomerase GutQ